MGYCEFNKNDIISLIDLEKLWSTNTRPTVLYINNPFCKTEKNCSYCVHRGCPTSKHTQEEVYNFYFSYIPKMLDNYKNIINKQDFKMVTFGGGTPNYLNATDFDNFCSMLPEKIKPLPKLIELHPAYLTEEFINVLNKNNFKTLIFCIQTTDEYTLKTNNRTIIDLEKLGLLINYAKNLNLNIAVDLITYWTKTDKDWEILEKDLLYLKDKKIDEITISVLYQNKYVENFNSGIVYSNIRKLVNKYFPDYINPEKTLDGNFNVVTTRIFKKNSEILKYFNIYINSLTDNYWEIEHGYSTLGIGTYKNQDKAVFSVIGPNYTIYEEYPNIYHLSKKYNFWKNLKELINKLELDGEPPVGSTFSFTNVCKGENIFYDHFKQGGLNWEFSLRNGIKNKYEIDKEFDYLEKIKRRE